ncbi:MAG: asparagine synthase (glutamine-hydrolyzing) [Calditrichia bacterium]
MCGIVGIYHFDTEKHVEQPILKRMNDAIEHRGPDDEGFFTQFNVGLAMRRLSIIDLSGGHQPIFSEDQQKVIVFNGEVYNFVDHRPKLVEKGYKFQTKTDTEVVLNMYQEHGLDFVKQLNGMFGLAIWDNSEKQLVLARDHIGIKPLYYYRDDEKVVFASEIKAILQHPDVKAELDMQGLSAFLKYGFTPAPFTMFKNIHKIPPAHFMRIRGRDIQITKYWDVAYRDKMTGSEEQIGEQLYDLLKSAVNYQLVSDVPLGAFLSGGIDSSGIVHLMKEIGTKTINTYCIGFGEGFDSYNELESASRFAKDYGTNHHEILVRPDVVDLFPKLIGHLDEPLADSSFLVTYLVSKLARETVTVILSGVGGDELFGGYRRYLNVQMNKYVKLMPVWFRRNVVKPMVNRLPVDRNSTVLNYFRLAKAYFNTADMALQQQYGEYTSVFKDDFRSQLALENRDVPDFYDQYFDGCDSDELLDKIMYFDLKTSLPEQLLMLSDKMTMTVSLEGRVPYLDYRVVEFAARIPSNLKLNGFKLRHIQKQIFRNKFPDYVFEQKKKGFGAPVGVWIREELRDMCYDLLGSSYIQKQGIFNPKIVQETLDDHFGMKEDYTDNLLALIAFQIWYEQYLA